MEVTALQRLSSCLAGVRSITRFITYIAVCDRGNAFRPATGALATLLMWPCPHRLLPWRSTRRVATHEFKVRLDTKAGTTGQRHITPTGAHLLFDMQRLKQ